MNWDSSCLINMKTYWWYKIILALTIGSGKYWHCILVIVDSCGVEYNDLNK